MKKLLSAIGVIILIGFIAWKLPSPYAGNTFPGSGNVGIGTVTPSQPLEVVGKSQFDSVLNVGGGSTGNFGELRINRGDGAYLLDITVNSSLALLQGGGDISMGPGGGGSGIMTFGGRDIFGGATDDGSTPVQIKGALKVDSIKMSGNLGDVLTRDASGYFVAKAPTGGGSGSGGTYTPTFYAVTNVTGSTVYGATYSISGKVYTVTVPFALTTTTTGSTVFDISLPVTAANSSIINGGIVGLSGANGSNGIAAINGTAKMRVSFNSLVTNPSGYVIFMFTSL